MAAATRGLTMIALFHAGWFAADALVVVFAAWLLVRRFGGELPSALEQFLGWGLAVLLVVAGSGVLLGAAGGLDLRGFLGVHLLVFIGLGAAGKSRLRGDVAAARALLGGWLSGTSRAETTLLVLLGLVSAVFVALAFATQPVVFDALTYRLSRVGHWLQEGRIGIIGGDDARLNYMPVVPDLVMAWFLTGSDSGYGAAAVAQAIGGLLALGATVGLARALGVGRIPALAAAGLVLGLPNVAPQFTAAYTDLFTTGVLAAGFYLWLVALRRGTGSFWGGAAAGLALGSKGTVLYFAPGLLVAVLWLAWRHRVGQAAWARTVLAAALAGAVFVGPVAWRNLQAYGGPFGPEEFVVAHHGRNPGVAGSLEKLRLNLTSSFAQLLEPNSQLAGWRSMVRSLGEAIIARLPEQDPYAFEGLNRRANLRKIYAVAAPDADVASTGILLPLLGLAAAITAWLRRKSPDGELALVWSVALGVFVVFLHWRVQWHPYLFRFLGLAAPWLAALAAWWIQILPGRERAVAWIVAGAAAISGLGGALFNTYQSGWPAIAHPTQAAGSVVYEGWRDWSARLDARDQSLRVALAVNSPLAAFYRQESGRRVVPEKLSALAAPSAEAIVPSDAGWVVVPVAQFIGKEGRVMGRTWLYDGDEHHPYSVAAFRALRAGETPALMIYRNRLFERSGQVQREFLVRSWSAAPLRLELSNPGAAACHYTVYSSVGGTAGDLAPGARALLELPLPMALSLFGVGYARPGPGSGWIEVKLLP
jgi:hypothetical protein